MAWALHLWRTPASGLPFFEQLGDARLKGAATTDIRGKRDSHAERLDREAVAEIRKARLHRKVATAIFFEFNGGQMQAEATAPEIRLAVGEPDLDLGHVETVLETLGQTCYYLSVERNRYRFSTTENLIKRYSDRGQASRTRLSTTGSGRLADSHSSRPRAWSARAGSPAPPPSMTVLTIARSI